MVCSGDLLTDRGRDKVLYKQRNKFENEKTEGEKKEKERKGGRQGKEEYKKQSRYFTNVFVVPFVFCILGVGVDNLLTRLLLVPLPNCGHQTSTCNQH